MTDKPENPPAFPTHNGMTEDNRPHGGMTLRDYFAGQALMGTLTTSGAPYLMKDSTGIEKMIAENAYIIADAMLKARINNPTKSSSLKE